METNKIKEARQKADLTQTEAAEKCGWSQPMWADFENGRYKSPGIETYRRAAKALGCELADIL